MTVRLRPHPLALAAVAPSVLRHRAASIRQRSRRGGAPNADRIVRGQTWREVRSGPSSAPAESSPAGRRRGIEIEIEIAISSLLMLGRNKPGAGAIRVGGARSSPEDANRGHRRDPYRTDRAGPRPRRARRGRGGHRGETRSRSPSRATPPSGRSGSDRRRLMTGSALSCPGAPNRCPD